TELITVDEVNGGAEIIFRTEYTGRKADNIRSYFEGNTSEYVAKQYLNYYSNLYPSVEANGEIKFMDFNQHSDNKVVVEEYYKIDDFWLKADDESYVYFESYPLVLETIRDYPKSAKRSMPYYLGVPQYFEQRTIIEMPTDWTVQDEDVVVSGDGFRYRNEIEGDGSTITIDHSFEINKSHIDGMQVDQFLKDQKKIQGELSYYFTHTEGAEGAEGFKLSEYMVIWVLISFAVAIFLAVKLHRKYNPESNAFDRPREIGGWMILPLIGLVVSPFVIIFELFSEDFFNQNTFDQLQNGYGSMVLLIFGEVFTNALLLVFTVLVLIQFFQRRTSLPMLITCLFVARFAILTIDSILAFSLYPELYNDADFDQTVKEIIRAVVAGAIWIPYFNMSQRVKNTFVNRIDPEPEDDHTYTYTMRQ
ncbi:MAG: DUF2569 domain-containing protein, partial [Bacteroidota bacterium]